MIDVSIRLRRAIFLGDLALVRRIIKNYPAYLQNPDLADAGNTSLHLSARLGLVDIVEYLIEAGHEAQGISRNADGDTPLMAAVGREANDAVVRLLIDRFERSISWRNNASRDALMIAARHGHDSAVLLLLTRRPHAAADPNAQDLRGETALHYASSYGHLKVVRTLLAHGADPWLRNHFQWTPVDYSSTEQAEKYLRGLVADMERYKAEEARKQQQQQQQQQQYQQHQQQSAVGLGLGISGEGGGGGGGGGLGLGLLSRGGVRLVSPSEAGSNESS